MTRLFLISSILGIVVVIGVAIRFAQHVEYPAHWREPEDGFAPGELPQADPRTTEIVTLLRGRQGRQPVYTRVGRERQQ